MDELIGWIVAICLVLFDVFLALIGGPLVSRYYTKQIVKTIWNEKVELEDLNGEVIKVPVTTVTKDKDGNEVQNTNWVIAPLWYTILYGAGSLASEQVKMALLSAKGKIAKGLNTAALGSAAGEIDMATGLAISQLPRKWQGPAIMLAQLLGAAPKSGTTFTNMPQTQGKQVAKGNAGFDPGVK